LKTNPRSVAPLTLFSRLGAALRLRRPPAPPAAETAPAEALALMLQTLAEEMQRLKREGAEVSRSLAETSAASRHMREAVLEANARLAESARLNTATAEALCLLPGIVNRQADRIDSLSDKAEALLAQPPADAKLRMIAARLEAAMPEAGLAQGLVAATERLDAVIAGLGQRPGDTRLLDQAAQRIEAATQMLDALPAAMEARLDTAAAAALSDMEAKLARLTAKLSRLASTAQGGLDARLGTGQAWPPEAATPIRRVS